MDDGSRRFFLRTFQVFRYVFVLVFFLSAIEIINLNSAPGRARSATLLFLNTDSVLWLSDFQTVGKYSPNSECFGLPI